MFFGYAPHVLPARLTDLGAVSSGAVSLGLVTLLIALAWVAEKHFDRPARRLLSRLAAGPVAPAL